MRTDEHQQRSALRPAEIEHGLRQRVDDALRLAIGDMLLGAVWAAALRRPDLLRPLRCPAPQIGRDVPLHRAERHGVAQEDAVICPPVYRDLPRHPA